MTTGRRIRLPGRTLTLVAGVPGSGKTTLLRGQPARPDQVIVDPDRWRDTLQARLPFVPYAAVRVLTHGAHRLDVVRRSVGRVPSLVVHLPATNRVERGFAIRLARLTRRAPHLVWLEVTPEQAREGQRKRRRQLGRRAFQRYVRQAEDSNERWRDSRSARHWASVTTLNRADVGAGVRLEPTADLTTVRD